MEEMEEVAELVALADSVSHMEVLKQEHPLQVARVVQGQWVEQAVLG